ncbi:metallophosphoesterase family protein [Aquibacillus rhizosphaerae]|uniref:DNA repair exonuclease n=1 Tax=Aquibacillus rhizosphaerae TaxID=3051431 RepID=A0ABT7LA43_9BACI|nr:DNA repair exonuclease [Aquibacillus sp. LR5S19]MDL4842745.1 DNA repair exonuclease [Aquibacillus sp. LR5S19]
MTDKVSFIHCADLHIDSPFKGLSNIPEQQFKDIRESTFIALDNLVDLAISKRVDFILMVGDLFDQNQQSIKAQSRLTRAFEKLRDNSIDVFISYGNHDHVNGRLFDYDYPNNVYVFESEHVDNFIFKKDDVPLATIYGFSYVEREVLDNKANKFKTVTSTPYQIAMLHGSVSSNTDHDVYAPFQISDLTSKSFDYWALGHIHKRQQLNDEPLIVYPGNIQGRSIKETGEKGCYHVEISETNRQLEFFPLQYIRFEEITIQADHCKDPQELEVLVEKTMKQTSERFGKSIVRLHITSDSVLLEQWYRSSILDEIIDFINELNNREENWVFIQDVRVTYTGQWDKQLIKSGHSFLGELLHSFDTDEIMQNDLQSLFTHRQARKYLDHFTDEEKADIKQKAEDLLIYQLLKE